MQAVSLHVVSAVKKVFYWKEHIVVRLSKHRKADIQNDDDILVHRLMSAFHTEMSGIV